MYTIFLKMTMNSDTHYWSDIRTIFHPVTDLDLIIEFDFLPNCVNTCNGCGMPTEDTYPSGHLVVSKFGTCMCLSNVEATLMIL